MITPESLAQIQQKYKVGSTPTAPTQTPGVSKPQGSLRDRVLAAGAKKQEEVKWQDKGVMGNLFQDVKETGTAVVDSLKKRGQNFKEAYQADQSGEQSALETGFQYATNTLGAGLDVLGNVAMGAGKAVLPEVAEKALSKGTEAVVNTDVVQGLIKGYEELSPRAQRNTRGAIDVASIIPGERAVSLAVKAAPSVAKATASVAKVPLRVTKATAETAGNTLRSGVAKVTGMEPETLSSIYNKPELFSKKNVAATNREDFADKVKVDIDKRIEDLSETGKEYGVIRDSGNTVDVSRNDAVNFLQDKFKLTTDKDGRITRTSESTARLSKSDETKLNEYFDRYLSKDKLTYNEYLNARRDLDDIAKFEGIGKSTELENVAKLLRRHMDDTYGTKIPGLKELDAKFGPEAGLLRDIKKQLIDKDGDLNQTAITKISNILQSNRRDLREALEKIRPGIVEEVRILRAMEDYTRATGNKIGSYGSAALTGGAIVSGGAWIVPAILAYPPIAIQIIRGLGAAKKFGSGIIESVVKKIKGGENLSAKEKEVVDEAMKTAKPSRKVRETIAQEAPEVANKYFSSKSSYGTMDSMEKDVPDVATESILSPVQVRQTANVASATKEATDDGISSSGGVLDEVMADSEPDMLPDNASLSTMLEYAPEAKADIDDFAGKIATRYGAKLAKAPIKSEGRASIKVNEYNGEASRLRDLVRNTIVVDADKINRIIETLKKKGGARIVKHKDQKGEDYNGYTGHILNYRTKNGLVGEIQVNTPKMIYAKEKYAKNILGAATFNKIKKETGLESGKGHTFYEEIRDMNRTQRRSKEGKDVVKESVKYYSNFI